MPRIAAFVLAAALALAATAPAAAPAADLARGEALAKGCQCHATEFHGADPERIVTALKAFRDGTRFNKAMQNKTRTMTDEDMQAVADWFAAQK